MADFAAHYDIVVLPTRARKPKDKALVESAVNILYTRVYAPLHDQIFHSLKDLNTAIKPLVNKHNQMLFQGKPFSRKNQFDNLEKSLLKALPDNIFEIKKYKEAKVHPNCHVILSEDKHHYSVPYQYIGQKVQVGYTNHTVEIYHKYERIAIHQRNRNQFKYTTNTTHLHPKHQYYKRWSENFFLEEGTKIGADTHRLVEQIFHQCKHPEQGYKTCQGILQLAQKYGNAKVDQAAAICLQYEFISYRKLERILSLNYLEHLTNEVDDLTTIPVKHENIRGQSYFK